MAASRFPNQLAGEFRVDILAGAAARLWFPPVRPAPHAVALGFVLSSSAFINEEL
jgi:hypothetical protein